MKRTIRLVLLLAALLLCRTAVRAADVTVRINGQALTGSAVLVEDGVTFVHIRPLLEALGGWGAQWDPAAAAAWTDDGPFRLVFPTGADYILADDIVCPLNAPILLRNGRTYLPLRAAAELLGAEVTFTDWDAPILVDSRPPLAYTEEDLFWLSRVISAESQGECLLGQLAVGSVVLNRLASPDYPDTIPAVIFDARDAVQFTPTANGAIYWEPTDQSVLAARLVLHGASVVADCKFFFAPALSDGTWIRENCQYYTTIGCHDFYR